MPNPPSDRDVDELPEVRHGRTRRTLPFVWIVPVVAALIGGWLVVKGIMEKGPTITIAFKTGEGLEAGKTKVKYKSVEIGDVKQIALAKDLHGVIATVELVKGAEPYLVEDTRFWVVRPRIAGGQVSGLGTLFSGSYIGSDLGKSTTKRHTFVGLEMQPIVTGDEPGRRFVLHADALGSVEVGSPVFFRQEAVGSVVAHEVNKDGQGVTFLIFINAPYDQYVNPTTRFWNASGIDMTLDASGVKVHTESLASILIGGVAFETLTGAGPQSPAEVNQEFTLFNNRTEAMKRPDTIAVPAVLLFEQSLRGLSIGAPVDFRGIVIGEVKAINYEYDDVRSKASFPVTVAIYPMRLQALMTGAIEVTNDESVRRARWDGLITRGLRAQLKIGSLLTGQLYVAVDFFPHAPKAQIDWERNPPALPTIPSALQEIQESLVSIVQKIDKMPLDQIGIDLRQSIGTLTRTLNSADKLVKGFDAEITPAAKATLENARKTFQKADRALAADSPLMYETQELLRELNKTAESLRELTDYLERHPEALIRGKKEGRQ